MPTTPIVTKRPLEVIRCFADAYARGEAGSVSHLLHGRVRTRTIVAGGSEGGRLGPDAVIDEARAFLVPYGRPEILYQTVEQLGPLFHWSMRLRLQGKDETVLVERHAFLSVGNGLITNIDAVCSGKLPEPR
jgi:hypothetical protein